MKRLLAPLAAAFVLLLGSSGHAQVRPRTRSAPKQVRKHHARRARLHPAPPDVPSLPVQDDDEMV